MISKSRWFVSAAVLAALVLAGCSHTESGGSSPVSGGSAASGGKTELAFVTNNASDYWTICRKGVEAAQAKLGNVDVQFVMPDDDSAATQKRDVDDLLAKGVQGIAISPSDPTDETPYLDTVAAKIPLLTSDSDAPQSKRLAYIGTDNHAAGVMAGGLIKEAVPQGGKIMLFVGKRDAQNAHDREQGIRDALKGSNITIVDVRTDDADHARAKSNAADALIKYPDLVCLVGLWSYNAPAIASAVKDAGKVGKVKIVAFDQEQGTVDGIKDGAIYGAVVQQPYVFGYKSVEMLAQLAKGDKSGLPKNGLLNIPTQVIKQANLASYLASQQKLLAGG